MNQLNGNDDVVIINNYINGKFVEPEDKNDHSYMDVTNP